MLKNKKIVYIIITVLIVLNVFAWVVAYDLNRPQALEVIFFDVGQGDSIFIETPQGHQILIDGGPTYAILEKLEEEMSFYDRAIDLIILTHPEQDHYFGLFEVLKRYEIENILWTGVVRDTAEWQEWVRLIEEEGAEIRIAEAGQKIVIGRPGLPTILEILHPFESLEGQEFKDSNDTSVVARLVFGDVSFLFTGDITKKVEAKLVEHDVGLESDVLKVAHHGSKTSSSLGFLEQVSPEVAVTHVGENSYGHPHPEVLANLEQFGIQVLRTDINGDIRIVSDGNNLIILE